MTGHVEAFESCPDLSYCKLDNTKVFGPVESFHKCPNLTTLDLQYSQVGFFCGNTREGQMQTLGNRNKSAVANYFQVTGNTGILRYAAPHCNPREILAMHQRLDPDLH